VLASIHDLLCTRPAVGGLREVQMISQYYQKAVRRKYTPCTHDRVAEA
jgi:hypothetical protein